MEPNRSQPTQAAARRSAAARPTIVEANPRSRRARADCGNSSGDTSNRGRGSVAMDGFWCRASIGDVAGAGAANAVDRELYPVSDGKRQDLVLFHEHQLFRRELRDDVLDVVGRAAVGELLLQHGQGANLHAPKIELA